MSFDFGSILRQYSDNTGVAGSSAPGSDASAGQQEIADHFARHARADRQPLDHRRLDIGIGEDERERRRDDVGGRARSPQRDRGQIADIIVMRAAAPRPARRHIQHRESLALNELRNRAGVGGGGGAQRHRVGGANRSVRPRIMRGEHHSGEFYIGDIAPEGMGAGVQRARWRIQPEPLRRSPFAAAG